MISPSLSANFAFSSLFSYRNSLLTCVGYATEPVSCMVPLPGSAVDPVIQSAKVLRPPDRLPSLESHPLLLQTNHRLDVKLYIIHQCSRHVLYTFLLPSPHLATRGRLHEILIALLAFLLRHNNSIGLDTASHINCSSSPLPRLCLILPSVPIRALAPFHTAAGTQRVSL